MPGTQLSWDGGIQVATDGYGGFEPDVVAPPAALPARVVAVEAIDSVVSDGTNFIPSARAASKPYARYRCVVGGKDVTYFRGVQTPMPTYGLVSPLLYGSGAISFPQIHAAYERPGHGSLAWLKKFAPVKIQRVNADGDVVATDFRGFIADFEHSGRDFSAILGGQATGLAAMADRPVSIFPIAQDVGGLVMRTIRHGLRLPTANNPTTGILGLNGGGGSQLDYLLDILAKSTERDGTQWTVMPNASGAYRMFQKDLETIDATLYIDGFRVVENLRRDFTEEPNRIWTQGIDPDRMRVWFAIFPGLASAPAPDFPGTLSPGDSGDGVTALLWRLYTVGYFDAAPFAMDWTTDGDDPVTSAIEDVQDDAGLSVTGVVNAATWRALFNPDVTGYSLRRSKIKPAAQKSFTKAFRRDATGQIVGQNPAYDRTKPFVDATIDMGTGFTRGQMQKWSQRELADPDVSNWVGTVTVTMGAVIDGEHNPSDTLNSSLVRDARSIKPGMNLWLANWDGGTLVHVSGVNVADGAIEFAVDTRARDTMKVWEVIARNRASRRSPARQWIAENRRSGMRDDSGAFYDGSVFGKIQPVFCPANQWTIFPTPGGRSGTLQKIDVSTRDDEALYVLAVFGKQISPGQLDHLIGNPLTADGTKNWTHKQKTLADDHWLVYEAGGVENGVAQLCGYWPETVDPNAFDSHTQTGSVDSATDTFTITGHGYSNGTQVFFSSGSVPDGLTADNNYFVIDATTDTFKVSASEGGSAMNITADASGVAVSTRTQATPPVTGDFRDQAGVAYFCKGSPVLWMAVYPDRDTTIQGGRVLTILLDDAAG